MLLSYLKENTIEVGCDEAGRGCLAGPVFAAAVILPANFNMPLLNDSKKLSDVIRYQLRPLIEKEAIAFAVAQIDEKQIDKINILNASILGMHEALKKIEKNHTFEHILVDGNRFKPYKKIAHTTIIKGDGKYASIAAASILAKTYRDDFMKMLHLKHPHYGWNTNMGYPTLTHRKGIREHGSCDYHRKSFTLLPPQLSLVFDK